MASALPDALDPRLRARAERGAAWVRDRAKRGQEVLVVHHIDADGVTAGAIAQAALEGAGVRHRLLAVKSMDQVHQDLVRRAQESTSSGPATTTALWFCDLGSTVYMQFPDAERLVCDHHQLVRDGTEEQFAHVNPLLDDLSGEELSGAGCAYLVAAALNPANVRLLPLALIGASADQQDRRGAFHGANAFLLNLAQERNLAHAETDLAFFGPQTRPLRKFLALAEPAIPTVSGDQRSAERFLLDCGIPLSDDDGERTWARLTDDERKHVRSRLVERLLDVGLPDRIDALFRTVVTLTGEPDGPTRELREFGTLLNSTARYGKPDVGLAVAGGNRGAAYQEALGLLLDHRKHLAGALDAFARRGVTERTAIQWVHLEDDVLDTVVGIVAGMAFDGLGLRRDLALVAFAHTPDGRTKVSTRSPHELQTRGIDLATACRQAAEAFGGQGGGHKGAAGATIARGNEAGFVGMLDRIVATQLGVRLREPVAATGPITKGRGPQTRLAV